MPSLKEKNSLTITLFLMTQKGFELLKTILDSNYHNLILGVVVGRDKQIENDFAEDIIKLCEQHNITYYERGNEPQIKSTYSIAVSWRWLINMGRSKLIVFHDSLLPKYRGFAPLVNMLINKEPKIGVSAIFATAEYDKGYIIGQLSTSITYPIKIEEAIKLISKNYSSLALDIFHKLQNNESLNAIPQDETEATYSLWRDESDYKIDWHKSAEELLHFVNAVSKPYKGAYTTINGRKIRILDVEVYPDVAIVNRDVGKVIFMSDKHPVIVCGQGLLKLITVIDDEDKNSLIPFKNFRVRLI